MIDLAQNAATDTLTQRNWERVLYLTNLTVIVLTVAVYVFPLLKTANVRPLVVVLIGFAVSFLVWTLLDGLGLADRSKFVAHVFDAPGLGWMDASLALLALAVVFAAWRVDRLNEPLAVVAGLTVVNGAIGYFQPRGDYSRETMASLATQGEPPISRQTDAESESSAGPESERSDSTDPDSRFA